MRPRSGPGEHHILQRPGDLSRRPSRFAAKGPMIKISHLHYAAVRAATVLLVTMTL